MATTWNSEDWFWKRTILYSAAAAVVVAGAGAYYYFKVMKHGDESAANAPAARPAAQPATPPPTEHHELPGAAASADKPLPPLNASDPTLIEALSGMFGKKTVADMLVPEQVVRHIVVTVDNLPRKKVAEQMRPVKPTPGETVAATSGDTITMTTENYARYAPLINVVESTDPKQLGALYIRFYPLFQQAYEDLGYPGQYFNDRLVEVIDDMLKSPDVRGPIELKQGRVFYEYADPSLESRSAGQKVLLRMGPENAEVLKKKLRALRIVVTTSQDPPEDTK